MNKYIYLLATSFLISLTLIVLFFLDPQIKEPLTVALFLLGIAVMLTIALALIVLMINKELSRYEYYIFQVITENDTKGVKVKEISNTCIAFDSKNHDLNEVQDMFLLKQDMLDTQKLIVTKLNGLGDVIKKGFINNVLLYN